MISGEKARFAPHVTMVLVLPTLTATNPLFLRHALCCAYLRRAVLSTLHRLCKSLFTTFTLRSVSRRSWNRIHWPLTAFEPLNANEALFQIARPPLRLCPISYLSIPLPATTHILPKCNPTSTGTDSQHDITLIYHLNLTIDHRQRPALQSSHTLINRHYPRNARP